VPRDPHRAGRSQAQASATPDAVAPTKHTVAGGLGAFQGRYGTNTARLCAGSLLIIAPSLLVFLVFQRNFVKALLQGAIM
jgi:ABC-type glycerol-3-phosphate transport system permease component